EGLVILGIIVTMMLADMTYDGAALALHHRIADFGCDSAMGDVADLCAEARIILTPLGEPAQGAVRWAVWSAPAGSLPATAFQDLGLKSLVTLATAGFWTHSTLVLIFLNLLPHSKHFHIITALSNAFISDLGPRGRFRPLVPSSEKLIKM